MPAPDARYADDLRQSAWLGDTTIKASQNGAKLQALGLVKGFSATSVANGQLRITANVRYLKGKTSAGVLIFLSRQPDGKVMITPNCSCPRDHMCEHVVAVMHEFMERCQEHSLAERNRKPLRPRQQARERGVREKLYLSCQILIAEDGGLALEVLKSPRPVIDGPGFRPCTGEDLFHSDLEEALSQRWMRALLERLQKAAADHEDSQATLQLRPDPDMWTTLIQECLKWQILYWGGGPNPVLLHHHSPRPATPTWTFDREVDGFLTSWSFGEDALVVVPSSPLHYVDSRRRLVGQVQTDFTNEDAARWVAGDRQPEMATVQAWNKALQRARFPLPPSQELIDGRETRPTPCLYLGQQELPRNTMRGFWSPVYQSRPTGSLLFRYGDHELPERGQANALDDARVRVMRNESAEREVGERLDRAGMPSFADTLPEEEINEDYINRRWIGTWETAASQAAWMTFMTEQVPQLEKDGWEIRYGDDFEMRFVRPDRWVQELREQRNRSWFEFELGVDCEGERIDLIPVLIAYLEHHADIERQIEFLDPEDKVPIQLDDGRYLAFPVKRLEPIVRIMRDILEGRGRKTEEDLGQIHQLVAADFLKEASEFTDAGPATPALQLIAHRLRDFAGVESIAAPRGLQATLRPYQEDGFRWLQFLAEVGLGGILADDMGLGKTLQTIAHLQAEKEKGNLTKPVLIVAPTSLLGNWEDELGKFAPDLRVHIHYGTGRHTRRQHFDAADVIITSYALIYRDQSALEKCCFSHLILDEAQNIKNPASRSAQAVCALDAERRLCISGTPMENHLEELWSLFHFLMPGFLGRQESFRQRFRHPIEKDQDEHARDLLASRVGPLMLRRKKTEVATELPPKTEMIRSVALEGPQRDLYETIRASMERRVQEVIAEQGIERAHLYILDALLKLRQVCCHPHLLDLEAAQSVDTSAKMELLFDLLPEMIREGRRVLVFSQFTSMLGLIQKRLAAEGIDHVKLTGNSRNRPELVKRFQEGEVPLFLISLKAGGVGLNLTKADTVIHYDPWWNPAVEAQATDRAYRIGQDNPVFVYKLITKGSIEERIVAMQEDKKELVESLLSAGTKRALKLDRADLERLLKPLS